MNSNEDSEASSPKFGILLIDGNELIFRDDLILQGATGGSQAALVLDMLLLEESSFGPNDRDIQQNVVMVFYSNKRFRQHVQERLSSRGDSRDAEEVSQSFFDAFTTGRPFFSVIDVGFGEEKSRFALEAHLRLLSKHPLTMGILCAVNHDFYRSALLSTCLDVKNLAILKATNSEELCPTLSKLGLQEAAFRTVFQRLTGLSSGLSGVRSEPTIRSGQSSRPPSELPMVEPSAPPKGAEPESANGATEQVEATPSKANKRKREPESQSADQRKEKSKRIDQDGSNNGHFEKPDPTPEREEREANSQKKKKGKGKETNENRVSNAPEWGGIPSNSRQKGHDGFANVPGEPLNSQQNYEESALEVQADAEINNPYLESNGDGAAAGPGEADIDSRYIRILGLSLSDDEYTIRAWLSETWTVSRVVVEYVPRPAQLPLRCAAVAFSDSSVCLKAFRALRSFAGKRRGKSLRVDRVEEFGIGVLGSHWIHQGPIERRWTKDPASKDEFWYMVNHQKPMTQQQPLLCHRHYEMQKEPGQSPYVEDCPQINCPFSHDYRVTDDDLRRLQIEKQHAFCASNDTVFCPCLLDTDDCPFRKPKRFSGFKEPRRQLNPQKPIYEQVPRLCARHYRLFPSAPTRRFCERKSCPWSHSYRLTDPQLHAFTNWLMPIQNNSNH